MVQGRQAKQIEANEEALTKRHEEATSTAQAQVEQMKALVETSRKVALAQYLADRAIRMRERYNDHVLEKPTSKEHLKANLADLQRWSDATQRASGALKTVLRDLDPDGIYVNDEEEIIPVSLRISQDK